jgi:chromosome segregation ATPase
LKRSSLPQHIDNLKKENFNVKLRVHFLEERLAQLAPDQIDAALKQNINLKIEVQQRGVEMKKLKKLVLDLDRELAHSKAFREENVESQGDDIRRRMEELEAENEILRARVEQDAELFAQREDEKEDLADDVEALRLEIQDLQRRREAEAVERSQSRAQILEEREEREEIEEGLNAVRDRLAATTIELQQKDDELEEKNREIEDLIVEHNRILEVVEQEWRGEVDEARAQVEELRDVRLWTL